MRASLDELPPEEVWQDTWRRLARATRDRLHAFRHPVVATCSPECGVRARTVVLRQAEPQAARLMLHTDQRSGKLRALASDPSLSWCFYDARQRVQVRAETRASVHVGDAVARAAWERQGRGARALYAVEPAPATRLAVGEAPVFDAGEAVAFERFAVVACSVLELDWLHLGRSGHRRIRFEPGDDGWQGSCIVP